MSMMVDSTEFSFCACGCGQRTTVAVYSNRPQGIDAGEARQYVHGHNRRKHAHDENPNPSGLCLCGCGQKTTIARRTNVRTGTIAGKPALYIKGHYRPEQHRLLNINEVAQTAECSKCGLVGIYRGSGGGWRCRGQRRASNLWSHYRMRLEDYDRLLAEQGGHCAMCSYTPAEGEVLHVDHDHSCCSGQITCGRCVRGLLCDRDNRALGAFGDDVDRMTAAIAYVVSHQKENVK